MSAIMPAMGDAATYTDTDYDNQVGSPVAADRISPEARRRCTGASISTTSWGVSKTFLPDAPAIAAIVVAYSGQTIRRTNRKNQIATETHNSQGAKLRVVVVPVVVAEFKGRSDRVITIVTAAHVGLPEKSPLRGHWGQCRCGQRLSSGSSDRTPQGWLSHLRSSR